MTLTAFQKKVKEALKKTRTTKKSKKTKKSSKKPSLKASGRTVAASSFRKMLHEQKYYDPPAVSGHIISSDALESVRVRHLDDIAQGAGVNTRIGKNFKLKSVHVRGQVTSNTATEASPYRLALVYDASPNKAIPAYADIFASTSAHTFPQRNNETRFTILHTWYDTVKGTFTATDALQKLIVIDRFIDVSSKGLYCMCTESDTTGAIGNRVAGALLMVAMSDQTSASSKAPVLTYQVRIEFDDA